MKFLRSHADHPRSPHDGTVGEEPLAGPNVGVVHQGIELRHHLLRGKALLAAFGHAQSCLSPLLGISTPPPR